MVKDSIRHAIQCTATNIKTEHVYTHTGWQKVNGKVVFLCNGLYLDNDIETNIELAGKLSRYCLLDVTKRNVSNDLEHVVDLFDEKFVPYKIMFPLLAIAFLSPLNHFLKIVGCEPKVILFLIEKRVSRKALWHHLFCHSLGILPILICQSLFEIQQIAL